MNIARASALFAVFLSSCCPFPVPVHSICWSVVLKNRTTARLVSKYFNVFVDNSWTTRACGQDEQVQQKMNITIKLTMSSSRVFLCLLCNVNTFNNLNCASTFIKVVPAFLPYVITSHTLARIQDVTQFRHYQRTPGPFCQITRRISQMTSGWYDKATWILWHLKSYFQEIFWTYWKMHIWGKIFTKSLWACSSFRTLRMRSLEDYLETR